jgi:hypothetical protein
MSAFKRGSAAFCVAAALLMAAGASAQIRGHMQVLRRPPLPPQFHPYAPVATAQVAPGALLAPQSSLLATGITLGDIGFKNGIRFANLGGRREIFVAVPQGVDLSASELLLTFDDLSAHEARRSLEVLVNDRSVAAIALDGKGMGRSVRVPLGAMKPRDGFLKLGFLYSGAATQDRCIDVRYVGDSLTIRSDTGFELQFDPNTLRDVATIAALMPREVTVVLPSHGLRPSDFAAAITIGRSLAATGRHATFQSGLTVPPEAVDANGLRRWTRGIVVIGEPDELTGATPQGVDAHAVPIAAAGEINAVRVAGYPALMISETASVRAARLLGNPSLAAARGLSSALVGAVAGPKLSADRVSFDQLGLTLAPAEVYGRADLGVAIDTRSLPADTRLSRLLLDIMVAPDGAGEKAVVSVFVNERLIASAVANQGEPTRIDLPLPDGLVGIIANVRAVVQRRSPQGDCRFEPQGYPAQILGSSTVVLTPAGTAHDFSDLATRWTNGVEIMLPPTAASQPEGVLGLLAEVVGGLSPETAPVSVRFNDNVTAAAPDAPFLLVGALPPAGSRPHVRFDRGRVAVTDRSDRTLLDLGGFTSGAVAQLVTSDGNPGIWIKPLAADGSLPAPLALELGRGDVGFIDRTGVALAMSTERDTLIHVAYPDQVSWASVAGRFRSWIVGALWLFATIAFLFALQRIRRRRPRGMDE